MSPPARPATRTKTLPITCRRSTFPRSSTGTRLRPVAELGPGAAVLDLLQAGIYLTAMRDAASGEGGCRGCTLALDYGDRRIGFALSDDTGLVARPLMTLTRTSWPKDLDRI